MNCKRSVGGAGPRRSDGTKAFPGHDGLAESGLSRPGNVETIPLQSGASHCSKLNADRYWSGERVAELRRRLKDPTIHDALGSGDQIRILSACRKLRDGLNGLYGQLGTVVAHESTIADEYDILDRVNRLLEEAANSDGTKQFRWLPGVETMLRTLFLRAEEHAKIAFIRAEVGSGARDGAEAEQEIILLYNQFIERLRIIDILKRRFCRDSLGKLDPFIRLDQEIVRAKLFELFPDNPGQFDTNRPTGFAWNDISLRVAERVVISNPNTSDLELARLVAVALQLPSVIAPTAADIASIREQVVWEMKRRKVLLDLLTNSPHRSSRVLCDELDARCPGPNGRRTDQEWVKSRRAAMVWEEGTPSRSSSEMVYEEADRTGLRTLDEPVPHNLSPRGMQGTSDINSLDLSAFDEVETPLGSRVLLSNQDDRPGKPMRKSRGPDADPTGRSQPPIQDRKEPPARERQASLRVKVGSPLKPRTASQDSLDSDNIPLIRIKGGVQQLCWPALKQSVFEAWRDAITHGEEPTAVRITEQLLEEYSILRGVLTHTKLGPQLSGWRREFTKKCPPGSGSAEPLSIRRDETNPDDISEKPMGGSRGSDRSPSGHPRPVVPDREEQQGPEEQASPEGIPVAVEPQHLESKTEPIPEPTPQAAPAHVEVETPSGPQVANQDPIDSPDQSFLFNPNGSLSWSNLKGSVFEAGRDIIMRGEKPTAVRITKELLERYPNLQGRLTHIRLGPQLSKWRKEFTIKCPLDQVQTRLSTCLMLDDTQSSPRIHWFMLKELTFNAWKDTIMRGEKPTAIRLTEWLLEKHPELRGILTPSRLGPRLTKWRKEFTIRCPPDQVLTESLVVRWGDTRRAVRWRLLKQRILALEREGHSPSKIAEILVREHPELAQYVNAGRVADTLSEWHHTP